MLVVNDAISIPLREFDFQFVRSSGPGGQNVNKVNTKAVLSWNVEATAVLPEGVRERLRARHARRINRDGVLVITSQRFRDQGRNVADCLEKLRVLLLEVASAPRPRKATRPSKAAKRRRLGAKRKRGEQKRKRTRIRARDLDD